MSCISCHIPTQISIVLPSAGPSQTHTVARPIPTDHSAAPTIQTCVCASIFPYSLPSRVQCTSLHPIHCLHFILECLPILPPQPSLPPTLHPHSSLPLHQRPHRWYGTPSTTVAQMRPWKPSNTAAAVRPSQSRNSPPTSNPFCATPPTYGSARTN